MEEKYVTVIFSDGCTAEIKESAIRALPIETCRYFNFTPEESK